MLVCMGAGARKEVNASEYVPFSFRQGTSVPGAARVRRRMEFFSRYVRPFFEHSTSVRCGREYREGEIRVEGDRQSQGADKDGLLHPEMGESRVAGDNDSCRRSDMN